MAIRREILLILLLLVVIVLLATAIEFFKVDVVEGDASKFVRQDLQSKYPDADIAIMTITSKYNEKGGRYFEVKARVTEDAETPCPKRSHIFYNYPAQNFVPQTPEIITSSCQVCTEGICTIAFPEEAIIASHTLSGTEDVHAYITTTQDVTPLVKESENSWKVTWNSNTADAYFVVVVHRNGTVLNVTKTEKL